MDMMKLQGFCFFALSFGYGVYDSTKSSKSVTFTSPDNNGVDVKPDGPADDAQKQEQKTQGLSISTCLPSPEPGSPTAKTTYEDDGDLWLAFLTETGIITVSDAEEGFDQYRRRDTKDTPESILQELNYYNKTHVDSAAATVRDDYEAIHRLCPGLFYDTIAMDDHKEAFRKAKRIIRDIVNSQSHIGPMFDIDFANHLEYYPTVEQRLEDIRNEIAPRQIFY